MSDNTPIYQIAKELGVESNRIITACKKLGISAKASSRRLNNAEQDKIIKYFETGKNVSEEIIEVTSEITNAKNNKNQKFNKEENINRFFPNRLIG